MYGVVNSSVLPPSIIEELVKDKKQYAGIGRLDVLGFSGGPLSEHAADLANRQTLLTSAFGGTEFAGVPTNAKDPEDWGYFRFDMEGNGIEMRETGQENMYEFVFVRKPELITCKASL
jgi:hypothetical protein